MCLTKYYYNTYADGTQDLTEKTYACKDGRMCRDPDFKHYKRTFPFKKLGGAEPESLKSLSERKPTPYFSSHFDAEPYRPRRSKSPSPSYRRDRDGVYINGARMEEYSRPSRRHDSRDHEDRHRRPYKHDPRDRLEVPDTLDRPTRLDRLSRLDRPDRPDRTDREPLPRLRRSQTMPGYVVIDQKTPPRPSSHVPLGPVPLAEEYGRRRSSRDRDRERDRERETSPRDRYYGRRHSADPRDYVIIDDDQERRRERRERRRMSTSAYNEASTSAGADATYGTDPHRFLPRRAATVVHRSDGSISNNSAGSPPRPKHLRWDDEVRVKRERQNAEIANRPSPPEIHQEGRVKGILKTPTEAKGKGYEDDDIYKLRRAVERMDIPRNDWDRPPRARFSEEDPDSNRRRRSRTYGSDRFGGDRYYY
ncbi:hypothetical protein B0T24DRAFT_650986 [Lasiosphaeria ovina]|uniref:Uncharacterized protein n=1 Tax=Lasiosphaeria ovina TaxID=92902 RepID=A0AAE0K3N1_9PEZI|nr:hypothetical protein B0T24DRAFT_650986 [Lasiosphaeria ovina]